MSCRLGVSVPLPKALVSSIVHLFPEFVFVNSASVRVVCYCLGTHSAIAAPHDDERRSALGCVACPCSGPDRVVGAPCLHLLAHWGCHAKPCDLSLVIYRGSLSLHWHGRIHAWL